MREISTKEGRRHCVLFGNLGRKGGWRIEEHIIFVCEFLVRESSYIEAKKELPLLGRVRAEKREAKQEPVTAAMRMRRLLDSEFPTCHADNVEGKVFELSFHSPLLIWRMRGISLFLRNSTVAKTSSAQRIFMYFLRRDRRSLWAACVCFSALCKKPLA